METRAQLTMPWSYSDMNSAERLLALAPSSMTIAHVGAMLTGRRCTGRKGSVAPDA
jgi:hypothetical protein